MAEKNMIINKCLSFIFIVCSLVYAQDDVSVATEATTAAAETTAESKAGDMSTGSSPAATGMQSMATESQSYDELKADKVICWNGLGYCDRRCSDHDSTKYEPLCGRSKSCCIPNKIVIDINTLNEVESSDEGVVCALNNGKCAIKCLPPTTVYRGSSNECPYRNFCCISATAKH